MKYVRIYASVLVLAFCISCTGKNKSDLPKDVIKSDPKHAITYNVPNSISRTIKQDRRGNIWIASWEGVFRYDGKSFTNITNGVSSARFFSILEDRKGNFWFGSIGSGVYHYDGSDFQNFTTKDGLINNEIVAIYEDKTGTIWFGANGGVSRYDGRSFRNYSISGDLISEDKTGKAFPDFTRPPKEVNAIIEDRAGKFWLGTRGNAFVYDGKTFTPLVHDGKPFRNVRTIIEDKKGNIWLGGNDGLWRYDGNTFDNITSDFTGYIYEDKTGNIWTSSQTTQNWSLSRYDEKLFSNSLLIKPTATEIKSNEGMIFSILEASDGNIWFGTLNGVYRYDGYNFDDFKGKKGQK